MDVRPLTVLRLLLTGLHTPDLYRLPCHALPCCRSEFEGILEKTPAEANAFLLDPEKYISSEWVCVCGGGVLPLGCTASEVYCMVYCLWGVPRGVPQGVLRGVPPCPQGRTARPPLA